MDENVTNYASYDEVLEDLKQQIEQYDDMNYNYDDMKFARRSLNKDVFYATEDLDESDYTIRDDVRTFKWQALYEDNIMLNSDYDPKPDADGRF